MTTPTRATLAIFAGLFLMAARAEQPSAAQRYFTDVELIDQDGITRRLYSDLIKGKVVVVNAFFASCSTACPVMAANFVKLQSEVESRLDRDVVFLSLTVDPETDSPQQLREYARKFGARPGWYLLTGPNVRTALQKFGLSAGRKEDHLSLFIFGNDRTGLWKKAMGMKPAAEILAVLNSVLHDQTTPNASQ